MDKFAKRLQSRLSAKGYRFNKEQCRQALSTTAANPELPTDAEMIAAFNWLTQCDSEQVEEIVTVESETSAIEPSNFINSFTGLAESSEETEAIAPIEKEEQIERQTNLPSSIQEPDLGPSPKANGIIAQASNSGEITQAHGGITQSQITQAISQAVAQVGQQGNTEAVEMLTTLANQLSEDIADTQEMVVALVNAYLGKRQFLLSSAIGTLNSLRTAQTEEFQAGLDQNFFGAKDQNKQEFLAKVGAMFN